MASGFDEKADGIAIYSVKLCNFLEKIGIKVDRLNVSRARALSYPKDKGIVHVQYGIQFFRGKYGSGIIPYLVRLRLLGSKVVVTVHDIPAEVQLRRSLAFFRLRCKSRGIGVIGFYGRLGKLIVYSFLLYTVLLLITLLANVTIVHTTACKKALFGRAIVIFHGSDPVGDESVTQESRDPLILTFGIIHRSRRVDFIMKEYSALPLYYVIAGASKDQEFVRFLAQYKPSNTDVVLTHPPLDRLIQNAWAVVIPPSLEKPEHASGVLHVASSFGKPVLSPPVGEVLDSPHFFITYNGGDSLRLKTMELVNDARLRMDYANRAFTFAKKTSFPRSAGMHARLYSSLVS